MRIRAAWGLGLAIAVAALGLSAYGVRDTSPVRGPNVVLVMTDDMRTDDLAFMPFTRQLLAGQGVSFEQMLSPYPLCCPARAEVLSGQYSHNNGVEGNKWPRGGYYKLDNSNTLPVWLSDHGYRTAYMGKYLNQYGGRDPYEVPPGWSSWHGSLYGIYNYTDVTLNENGEIHPYPHVYQVSLFDHMSSGLVREYDRSDQPYFMWISYVAPHAECRPTRHRGPGQHGCWHPPPPEAQDRGTMSALPPLSDPSVNEADMSDKSAFMQRLKLLTPSQLHELRVDRLRRIESLQSVDRAVAHLVATLKATGQYRNTYILFTSDNGIQLGEHRWRYKVLGYEPSVDVPLIIEGPGIPHGVVRHQAVTTVDLAATIADITHTKPGRVLDGESLLPLAEGKVPDTGDRVVPLEAGPMHRSTPAWLYQGVRTSRYTLLRWANGDLELYDRRHDPYEMRSVAGNPRYAAIQQTLVRRLDHMSHCAGPSCLRWIAHPKG